MADVVYFKVEFYFSFIIPAALGPEFYSVSNRNECQNLKKVFLDSRKRPVSKTGKFAAISEPIFLTILDPQHFINL
jgi:hypothetical protein